MAKEKRREKKVKKTLPGSAQPDHSLSSVLFRTRKKHQLRGMGIWFSYCVGLTANSDPVSDLHNCENHSKVASIDISF